MWPCLVAGESEECYLLFWAKWAQEGKGQLGSRHCGPHVSLILCPLLGLLFMVSQMVSPAFLVHVLVFAHQPQSDACLWCPFYDLTHHCIEFSKILALYLLTSYFDSSSLCSNGSWLCSNQGCRHRASTFAVHGLCLVNKRCQHLPWSRHKTHSPLPIRKYNLSGKHG